MVTRAGGMAMARAAAGGSSPGRARARLELWLIDDTPEHHHTVRATIAHMPQVRFTSFTDGREALEQYGALVQGSSAELPEVVLMDFYLGATRGDAVTRALRLLQPESAALVIVGYSSVAAGSRAIVEAGGDTMVRKTRPNGGPNPELARWLAALLGGRPS
jgi:CheY-like chemotaxis protein